MSRRVAKGTLAPRFSLLASGGRLDAVRDIGGGVILAAARGTNSGKIWRSTDYGITFSLVTTLPGSPGLLTLATNGNGRVYVLTDAGALWVSTDGGLTWSSLGTVASVVTADGATSYGLWVTSTGTVLVSDTQHTGGRIYRSSNGGASFTVVKTALSRGLYRFNNVGDGIIVNGWAGAVYRSTDDGATWSGPIALSSSPLFAVEYCGNGIVLMSDDAGAVFRSINNGVTWSQIALTDGGSDDMAYLGNGRLLYVTYTSKKQMFLSENFGDQFLSLGPPATAAGDNYDHIIPVNHPVLGAIGVFGTVQGFVGYVA